MSGEPDANHDKNNKQNEQSVTYGGQTKFVGEESAGYKRNQESQ